MAFLTTDLETAKLRDDRASVTAQALAATKIEQRLAAETAAVGTPEQVRAFLATGAYPGKDDDDRLALSKIMSSGGPRVREAAGKALDGTIDDVRAFLATGQYAARDDDNRLLVSQAISAGGPEVQAAARAVMSGPTSGLQPFLSIGLAKAQQRDAVTAAHVATVAAYLQDIDGNTALASQYAAEAAAAYATARGASDEAKAYAGQARTSADEAAAWASQAAESARQARASADRAAGYAKQARASAASADAAAHRAEYSAAAAGSYEAKAKQFAADAQDAKTKAQASATAAGKSAEEAQQAARDAAAEVGRKQQADNDDGKLQNETAVVDSLGRVSYIVMVPRPDVKYSYTEHGSHCVEYDPEFMAVLLSNWREEGKNLVCDQPVTVKATGTLDYFLKTCPEPGLAIATCLGRYSTWETVLVDSQTLTDVTYEATVKKQYKSTNQMIFEALTGDFVKCWNNPGVNASCAWAASNFIPWGTLAKGVKGIAAFRLALETGIGLEDAKLAVQASLDGYKAGAAAKLTQAADLIEAVRASLRSGVGIDEALAAIRANPYVDRALVERMEAARNALAKCKTRPNSFLAGTPVLMADRTTRPIETVRVGDRVLATDPVTGETGARTVTATIRTPDDREFTELTVRGQDGATGALTGTDHHPFWVENRQAWADAAAVLPGDTLRTDTGAAVQVASVRHWTGLEPAYNLSVDGLHTYYVQAGGTAVLVHNTEICEYYGDYTTDGTELIGTLEDGALSMVVIRGASTTPGWQMFDEVMAHFKPENVRRFDADWGVALDSNLKEFNENLLKGMSLKDAARNTFSGRNCARYGLTEVEIDSSMLVGTPGHYTKAAPKFTRPTG
ncbi:hypothetical protein KCH_76180 [Kitasatospora cheerisanensis KCTC 2395]|uniref:Uncharacterized protein n=2 Tax=Kitasatospora cheerisanensis TaxID=81942 RepID=A0A066YHN3_9ACTN|nr:polymorphic toxin-type HINT domain-containing protein [Kitasatospora cheerisanensis]KDN80642.1 hypothetical protein KCH_76180 [Kitasatospora cheerisanensis KCTC 2395]